MMCSNSNVHQKGCGIKRLDIVSIVLMTPKEIVQTCNSNICSTCPIWDIDNNMCFFALSQLPCQWRKTEFWE